MAYATKETIEDFIQRIEGGWEPEIYEIKNKYYPQGIGRTQLSEVERENLTRKLIQRVRRKLKKQEPPKYFYCVGNGIGVSGKFKLLESSSDRLNIINKLNHTTTGFAKSTHHLLKDTAELYPVSAKRFLDRIQASFDIIIKLASGTIQELKDELEREEVHEDEDSNK